ncbi:ATP-binding cassette domain-containing protein [Marinigracilibium pacificum]|uniref:ATP-binding cassette domain-containing protein n=1 Tax=Marinigracilibium pacificum TaxID=2729599 RepID=A0A848IZA4_9BACT|nr:ATP-binding cassette domain-containing protein [Marinigracilibium pacificum]NMM48615.1 ATP-binding cassette domain-containing protein [Marinigracilibium pacificum]
MSEEILKALTQLFAIITKQDGGVTDNERKFVIDYFKQELDQDSIKEYLDLYDQFSKDEKKERRRKSDDDTDDDKPKKERKLTSVRDSVKTLAICKKINKTLTQKQKVVVLIKLFELVASDKKFTPQRMEIINTVSEVFKFSNEEYELIRSFVSEEQCSNIKFENILCLSNQSPSEDVPYKHLETDINGEIIFLVVSSVDLYFVKYIGSDEVVLNGFIMKPGRVYLFGHGSTIKTPTGAALYYSELIRNFRSDAEDVKLSFNVTDVQYNFPNGGIGLRDINISEGPGKLIGIMGASGAGKTTLLNVLAGINKPTSGKITINELDIFEDKDSIHGVIGYVAQDDLLIEELTVYENLFYNAKLCFADLNDEEIDKRVMDVLQSLGLEQRKDLRVGSVLDKTISGGQRKRLNIALELIREPSVMFVDEPTSGLSSRDSENVIDLLKELSLKGKLIFVVIHQPSSDIYKMFDKMYILDTGGYPVYYGNPVGAVTYFKSATNQVDSERGQCASCGNVNPEQIFNIIEAKVVDEYGEFTNKRKMNPKDWYNLFKEKFSLKKVDPVKEEPPKSLNIPSKLKQLSVFVKRDFLSKISNKQYLTINFLEAPLLAVILAFIIRYKNSPDAGSYFFRFNENIPAFMMMAIVVALFMGLSVSAEEIIKDRKILKREAFLNLSWNSYLTSKVINLFLLSAIQTLLFVLIGNLILEIKGMTLPYWAALFSLSCFANILGLNISSAFNSAVTVYILIPILLIPQMILSGLLFPFDKLNSTISSKGEVPIVADMMASRWAFEAMAVKQFKDNRYESEIYPYEQLQMKADYATAYHIPKIEEKIDEIVKNVEKGNDSTLALAQKDYKLLIGELNKLQAGYSVHAGSIEQFKNASKPELIEDGYTEFNKSKAAELKTYLGQVEDGYYEIFNFMNKKLATIAHQAEEEFGSKYIAELKNDYFNESLSDLVRNISTEDRILEYKGGLLQQINPIYNTETYPKNILDYRAHFYAPQKQFLGIKFNTFTFNILVIWFMTLILYIFLYFELLKKFVDKLGNISLGKDSDK